MWTRVGAYFAGDLGVLTQDRGSEGTDGAFALGAGDMDAAQVGGEVRGGIACPLEPGFHLWDGGGINVCGGGGGSEKVDDGLVGLEEREEMQGVVVGRGERRHCGCYSGIFGHEAPLEGGIMRWPRNEDEDWGAEGK